MLATTSTTKGSKTVLKEKKAAIVKKFGTKTDNTGSTSVQVALITNRINELTEHCKTHAKDFLSKKGLMKLVGQRRRLLNYLRLTSNDQYAALIKSLELRK
jgi:small subunit ribosomal protein S15